MKLRTQQWMSTSKRSRGEKEREKNGDLSQNLNLRIRRVTLIINFLIGAKKEALMKKKQDEEKDEQRIHQ